MTKLVGGKSTEREIRLTHTHTHQLLSQPERIRSAFVGVASRLFVSHGPLTLMFKVYFWNNNSTDSDRREVKGITCCVIFVFFIIFWFFYCVVPCIQKGLLLRLYPSKLPRIVVPLVYKYLWHIFQWQTGFCVADVYLLHFDR